MGNYLRTVQDAETDPVDTFPVPETLPLAEVQEKVVNAEMSFFAFSMAPAAFWTESTAWLAWSTLSWMVDLVTSTAFLVSSTVCFRPQR